MVLYDTTRLYDDLGITSTSSSSERYRRASIHSGIALCCSSVVVGTQSGLLFMNSSFSIGGLPPSKPPVRIAQCSSGFPYSTSTTQIKSFSEPAKTYLAHMIKQAASTSRTEPPTSPSAPLPFPLLPSPSLTDCNSPLRTIPPLTHIPPHLRLDPIHPLKLHSFRIINHQARRPVRAPRDRLADRTVALRAELHSAGYAPFDGPTGTGSAVHCLCLVLGFGWGGGARRAQWAA
jgi:hypothetical protein